MGVERGFSKSNSVQVWKHQDGLSDLNAPYFQTTSALEGLGNHPKGQIFLKALPQALLQKKKKDLFAFLSVKLYRTVVAPREFDPVVSTEATSELASKEKTPQAQ